MRVPFAGGRPTTAPSTPMVGTYRLLLRTLGALYLISSLLGGPSASAQPPGLVRFIAVSVLVIAAVAGIGLVLGAATLPAWSAHVAVVFGMCLLAVSIRLSATTAYGMANSTGLILISSIGLFFGWRATLAHQAIATVIIVTALGWRDPNLIGPGLVVAGTGVAVAAVVGTLVRLARRSLVDEATGLLNRRGLERALDERLDDDQPLTIAVLDLDGFAAINHSGGRTAGDAVLRDFARGLAVECPAPLQVGRSGGDEFVMLMPGVDENQVLALTQRLRRSTGVSFCSGITVLHPDDSPSTLLARADTALYQAKRSGRNRDQVRSEQGSHLSRRLRTAITDAQISVHYQPIVDLDEGNRVIGVEALARWYTGATEVSPALFVPVAEDEGLIADLGRLVLRTALADVERLRAAIGADVFVSVNVSGKELVEPGFVTGVTRALADCGAAPDALLLEVTESTLDAQTPVAAGALRRLRAEGVRIAIDDFGTGYSSLSRLDALPVDLLKLDGSFVSDTSAAPTALLRAVTALGEALGLPIVAECVARETNEALVRDAGIHLAQGWLYSPALPIDDLLERLHGSRPAIA